MLDLKQLIQKENFEMQERRKNESMGCYFIFYLLTMFYILSSTTFALSDNDAEDRIFLYTILWTGFLSVILLYGYLYRIKENGKYHNIFLKYKYIPINLNKLLLAKTIILSKKILRNTMFAQTGAIIARIIYVHTDGVKFFNIVVFTPAISGILFFLIVFIMMFINRQAVK